ncbi:MAG: hypothetical protein IH965_14425 [Gemmatimonadetes bacterium]|nr:hypothetical protein [Gemmatimonadota bacterium]
MDDLFQVMIVLGIIIFGLLGGRKKKPRQQRPAGPTTRPRQPAGGGPPRQQPTQPPNLQEIERILRQGMGLPTQVPTPQRPQEQEGPPVTVADEAQEPGVWQAGLDRRAQTAETLEPAAEEPGVWQAGLDRPAQTLETLEPAGGTSHERFHKKYLELGEPLPPPATVTPMEGPQFSKADLRRLIVWREILGPPLGLRQELGE